MLNTPFPRVEGVTVYLLLKRCVFCVYVLPGFTHVVAHRFAVATVAHFDTRQASVSGNVSLRTLSWLCTLAVCQIINTVSAIYTFCCTDNQY